MRGSFSFCGVERLGSIKKRDTYQKLCAYVYVPRCTVQKPGPGVCEVCRNAYWEVGALKEFIKPLVHRMYSEHRVSSCILCPALALIELCPGLENLRRKQTLGPDPSGDPGVSVFCSFFLLPPTSLFHSFPLLHHLQDRNPHPHSGLLTSLPFQMAPGIEFKSSALAESVLPHGAILPDSV